MKMASDESSMNIRSSISVQEDEDDGDITDETHVDDHDHSLRESNLHNCSRLSMCTGSSLCGADVDDDDDDNDIDDDDEDNNMRMYMSCLSIESFDGDVHVDDQFSDHDKQQGRTLTAWESDEEVGCYSLPVTPPGRSCSLAAAVLNQHRMGGKGYASENEVGDHHNMGQKMMYYSSRNEIRRRKRVKARRMGRRNKKEIVMDEDQMEIEMETEIESGSAGEMSEAGGGMTVGGGGGGLVVITRPKGGRRSLCMDMEEVKACRDLGFELEDHRMLEIMSTTTSTTTAFSFDTASSGGNSPIANWRISSPGKW